MIWTHLGAFVAGVLVTLLVEMLVNVGRWWSVGAHGHRQGWSEPTVTARDRDWVRTSTPIPDPPEPGPKPPEAA